MDPVGFLAKTYFPCNEPSLGDDDEEDTQQVCTSDTVIPPDFVVTFSKYSEKIRPQLELLGLRPVARFLHHVNGAKYGDATMGTLDFYRPEYRHFRIIGGLEVSVDEMVLYSRFK